MIGVISSSSLTLVDTEGADRTCGRRGMGEDQVGALGTTTRPVLLPFFFPSHSSRVLSIDFCPQSSRQTPVKPPTGYVG
jgi:hypothetical protein